MLRSTVVGAIPEIDIWPAANLRYGEKGARGRAAPARKSSPLTAAKRFYNGGATLRWIRDAVGQLAYTTPAED
jgi:hypothetical protein